MNPSFVLILAFVAAAAAYVPVQKNLDINISEDVSVGQVPYTFGQYPYYQGFNKYPYYQQQYGYGYPYYGLNKQFGNYYGYLYGRQYPYYGYQSPISSQYGYPSYYPYYNYHQYQQIPYQYYGYQYPIAY